ncbi:MAG TPA: hypothetical protein VFI11_04510 [Anaerolineales bacterium]|nr:hypothetical protein [Anaerolineales bacterium]
MAIGVYACASLGIAGLSLAAILSAFPDEARWGSVRRRLRLYFLWGALFPALGLILFLILSVVAGLLRLGQTQSLNLPAEYVRAGPLGWTTLFVFVLGALSPALAAFLAARRNVEETPTLPPE